MEIERKFTLRYLPEKLEKYISKRLEQGYLCTNPVVRVRKSVKEGEAEYILCYKSKTAPEKRAGTKAHVCEEVELPLTKESYARLLSKAEGRVITKTRYLIPYGAYTIELDVFEGELSGLRFAEVEFPNEEEADAFVMPEWFEADVTFDDRFRNNYLAQWAEAPEELRAAGIIKTGR